MNFFNKPANEAADRRTDRPTYGTRRKESFTIP